MRAAERDAAGTWRAVPWVKRGILLGFRAGHIVDMSPRAGNPMSPFTFFDKHTIPTRAFRADDCFDDGVLNPPDIFADLAPIAAFDVLDRVALVAKVFI